MGSRWPDGRLASAVTAALVLAGAMTAVSPAAAAAACQGWVGGQPPSPDPSANQLNAVTVLSPCNAWAVGTAGERNVIEHWNGAAWKVVPSPHPGAGSFLGSVAAVSASDVWAVGGYFKSGDSGDVDLIMHWNGRTWKRVPCPSPGPSPRLSAVRAVSAKDAWAVGIIEARHRSRTIILHWDGRAWTQVHSPNPGSENNLEGLTVISPGDAWAVGQLISNNRDRTLILHWNGRSWSQVKSPDPGTSGDFLSSADATSAGDAWAVGSFTNAADVQRPLILHWNGRTWARVKSPIPGGRDRSSLAGVDATSAGNAWAVGSSSTASNSGQTVVILHWNGRTWKAERGPRPGTYNELFAVSASSSGNVWAVGDFIDGGGLENLAFHCC